jgi:hypothetical protein
VGKPVLDQPALPKQAPPAVAPKQTAAATGTVNPPPAAADKPGASSSGRAEAAPPSQMPELLKDPVPRITAILLSADRRLATVGDDGQIIAVGDTIGRRVVVSIDERTVLLREPSGVQIRVGMGGRVVSVERGGR